MLTRLSYINRGRLLTSRFRYSIRINNILTPLENQHHTRFYSTNEKLSHQPNAHDPIDIDSLIADLPDSSEDGHINNTHDDKNVESMETLGTKERINEDKNIFGTENTTIESEFSGYTAANSQNNESKVEDDFDALLESLSLDIETPKDDTSTKSITELVNTHMEGTSKYKDLDKEYKPVDIDRSDENVFGFDFLDLPNKSNDKSVIDDEKQLFQNIFNSYIQPVKEKTKYDKNLILNLRESVKLSQSKIDNLVEQNNDRYKLRSVSPSLKVDIFRKTQEALASNIQYINTIDSSRELLVYIHKIFIKWINLVEASREDNSLYEDIYMNKLLRAKTKFGKKHNDFITKIENASIESPQEPILNVFTLPIIFNSVLKLLTFKFKNGQLVMSLFNVLKKDINLYTVVCNQQTYNEVLRSHWIFNGKSNLYGVEIIYLEMMNNGFNGDLITFNILKQIIIDYYNLKMGKSDLNKETGMPIWTKEDDRRIEFLEKRLSRLANTLSGRYI